MKFGKALEYLKSGEKVQRAGWNGKAMWLELRVPYKDSKMTLPYIYMVTVDLDLVPWTASQTDMLAGDWSRVLSPGAASTSRGRRIGTASSKNMPPRR